MPDTDNRMDFWHARYLQQAGWTAALRNYLLPRAGIGEAQRLLEAGCGTGALLGELETHCPGRVHGLDIDPNALQMAIRNSPAVILVCGDALRLPYASGVFDVALCHYVLLWLEDPLLALREMARTVRSGGAVVALAEPDYGGRIDYPPELEALGKLQTSGLRAQGADPLLGRKLVGFFQQAGLVRVESGVLGAQWTGAPDTADLDLEWQVLQQDLKQASEPEESPEANRLMEAAAWQRGERVLYVPTFYAWGIKP